MIRLAISCEGQTEQDFVKRILAPHFHAFGATIVPVIVTTRRVVDGPNQRGGAINVDRVAGELRRLVGGFDHVTSLYDLYGFRNRLPGETVEALEVRIRQQAGSSPKLHVYVQQHEFVALVFACAEYLPHPGLAAETLAVRDGFASPEDINQSPETCCSGRLDTLYRKHLNRHFEKLSHGIEVLHNAGLGPLRQRCPRFAAWIDHLERIARGSV